MLLTDIYLQSPLAEQLEGLLKNDCDRIHLSGIVGSQYAAVVAALAQRCPDRGQMLIAADKEEAHYLLNDIEALLDEGDKEMDCKRALLFPTTYRRPRKVRSLIATESAGAKSPAVQDDGGDLFETDNANILQRSEVVKQLNAGRALIVVTWPEALYERVVSSRTLTRKMLTIMKQQVLSMDFAIDILDEYGFEQVDFVVSPGQYAVRGGILDVFSYANEHPFRIEFFDEEVESLRSFDVVSQLSIRQYDQIVILPNMEHRGPDTIEVEEKVSLLHYYGSRDMVWVQGLMAVSERVETLFAEAGHDDKHYCSANDTLKEMLRCRIVEVGGSCYFRQAQRLEVHALLQPVFNKQFGLLVDNLREYREKGYRIIITTGNEAQQRRLSKLLEEGTEGDEIRCEYVQCGLHRGFVDDDLRMLCYTDHEIFDRYHKYTVRDLRDNRQALTLKELTDLKPGDFVTHIDYGVGRFAGLEKLDVNGRSQEVIRLYYKNNDVLYVSIHSLHKITRYVGKEGTEPTLNRLGSGSWQALKQKTKKQVKDIARDLILLYAKRKASRGYAYSADNYLQEQLEASFCYEDTPDQLKATREVKHDMEASAPMDRLVCGDVGFGKTEVAIRAAFKACCDSKQVAVLVPNTILAFQHYNTFRERLEGLPVTIDYLNRFRTAKEKNVIYQRANDGKIDILIGTHAILNKNLHFKDLGLLIIDEEQKFGVSAKEKLRQLKVNVDCLTLTATPIPRTLQFSLMGARDLSVIRTAPPNRQPIQTEISPFDEELIRDAIRYEMSRGGQTFFVSNRVENLDEMAGYVARLNPDARIGIAHGQMDGKRVEETMMHFLAGDLDVLVATAIVENGLDIPNANTMIVNNAQNFGLSDLHQMRGRVGRSNKKAFCYMLVPSYATLTDDARKRLRAIEEFSGIGSGLNIAMRDLDIRGAGNILGAEQSGFISDIGYEMYHKILNEAIEELKETEFHDLFIQEKEEDKAFVHDCLIVTDIEALLPDDYVSSTTERLLLYKELNDLDTDAELDAYRERLIDRFGPIPKPAQELIKTITLRRMAKKMGVEKLVLKQDRMLCHFVANPDNPFYKSPYFMRMIAYVQSHPQQMSLQESTQRLSLTCTRISTLQNATECIAGLLGTATAQGS